MNVWAFYRRSTEKQELSIEDQRRECRGMAEKMGWTIVREFMPVKGWGSGLTIDQDPAFQEMVRLAEAGGHGVQTLVVYDVSRFGRLQPEDKIYWERRLKKQGGIQIVYVKDDFKNDGSIADVLTKVVKHSEAHQFSMKLSETTLRGCKSHAGLGHSTGGKAPYGYDRLLIDTAGVPVKVLRAGEHKADKTQRIIWTPNVQEKAMVRWIFETYLAGNGLNRIVNSLNDRKVAAPRGRHWVKNIVHHILRNRAYLGERIYNKRSYKGYRRGDRGSLFNPRDQWIVKEAAHEPILHRDLFDAVQAKLKTKVFAHTGRTWHRPYLLTGLCICGNCGYRMIGCPKKGNGHLYYTYTCSGYLRSGKSVCRSVNVSRDEIEGLAIQSIREHLADPGWRAQLIPQFQAMIQEHFGGNMDTQLSDLRARLADVERKVQNVVRAVEDGVASHALADSLQRLEGLREELRGAVAEAEGASRAMADPEGMMEELLEVSANFDGLWEKYTEAEQRKEFIRQFVQNIKVTHSPERIETTVTLYKFPWLQNPVNARNASAERNPLITSVTCGGRNWTQVMNARNVVQKTALLKPPYVHHRRWRVA